jgi:recombination protein RecT
VTTGKQVARPADMIRAWEPDFAAVLPSHVKPETFVRVAIGALRRDPQLERYAQQNPASLGHALLEAARLGLEPGTAEYYLTPRPGKGGGGVLGIVGYQGEIELIYRAGAVTSVKADLVHAADTFEYRSDMDRPRHVVDWFSDRGEVRGAYAYAEMAGGGFSKVVVVGPAEIARAMEASPTAKSPSSPWRTDYGAMVLKTAVHRLAKWVPTSAEYRREQIRAAAVVAAEVAASAPVRVVDLGDAGPWSSAEEVVDAEVVADDEEAS